MVAELRAPFPWFGGKSRVAGKVWDAFGDVPNYVEPFFGSGAVLLARPHEPKIETVNDKDAYICNFYRAVRWAPDEVAHWCDWPVNETDLYARHLWLVERKERLRTDLEDPEYFDAKVAGWWVWGISQWIGSGWCEGATGRRRPHLGRVMGIHKKRPHLGNSGMGVHRQRPHLGRSGMGVHMQLPYLGRSGMGVHKKMPNVGDLGKGIHSQLRIVTKIGTLLRALSERLRRVRVCCGDWSRICGPTPTFHVGLTGVFLDPPYSAEADRDHAIYLEEDLSVAHSVRAWCAENGDNKLLRIALCGYEGEHNELEDIGWAKVSWKAKGGLGNCTAHGRGRENAYRERIWFSPHCLDQVQRKLL